MSAEYLLLSIKKLDREEVLSSSTLQDDEYKFMDSHDSSFCQSRTEIYKKFDFIKQRESKLSENSYLMQKKKESELKSKFKHCNSQKI